MDLCDARLQRALMSAAVKMVASSGEYKLSHSITRPVPPQDEINCGQNFRRTRERFRHSNTKGNAYHNIYLYSLWALVSLLGRRMLRSECIRSVGKLKGSRKVSCEDSYIE